VQLLDLQQDRLASIPVDETAAAKLAAAEIGRFLSIFEKERSQVIRADLQAVQRLLTDVTRVQKLGTYTAELMTTLR